MPEGLLQLLAQARADVLARVKRPLQECVLFFSLSDGKTPAHIFRVSGPDADAAWQAGVQRCQEETQRLGLAVCWLRVDWPTEIRSSTWGALKRRLARIKRNYFRFGLALDQQLMQAFLETELNANAMLYSGASAIAAQLNENNFMVHARRRYGRTCAVDFSDDAPVWSFAHEGVFVGHDATVLQQLASDSEPTTPTTFHLPGPGSVGHPWTHPQVLHSGHRQLGQLQAGHVVALVQQGAVFLAKQVKKDGQFVYGHFPCFARQIPTYNSLRHASTLYAMLEAWELVQDEELLAAIRRGLTYLVQHLIRIYPQPNGEHWAFNVDPVSQEIKLGANAVSILALVKYDELTGDTQYRALMESLALGIRYLQQGELDATHQPTGQHPGKFVHVVYADDLRVKDAFRIVYYDGEAAFGLMRLYGLTQDKRWLAMVEQAFGYFIDAQHWQHHDHWLSYCVNELTHYKPEERYFRFGVQNIAGHLDFMQKRETTFPTLLELAMAFDAMLQRIHHTYPHMQHVLHDLDEAKFYRVLQHRAHYSLNGFFWPELAMYYAKPQQILGSFFIRHHAFRVRIDDVEHYLSGYVAYWKWLQQQTQMGKPPSAPTENPREATGWTQEMLEAAVPGQWLVAPDKGFQASGITAWLGSHQPQNLILLAANDTEKGVRPADLKRLNGAYAGVCTTLSLDALQALAVDVQKPVYQVKHHADALYALARHARRHFSGKVVAVTGSAGKTTITHMLASVMGSIMSTASSKRSANLPFGVAWNMCQIPWQTELSVLELAIGGMVVNTELARPDIAVITNIAPAHLLYHKTIENVAQKKARIFEGVMENGWAVICRDTACFDLLENAARQQRLHVLTYGEHPQADIRLQSYHPTTHHVTADIRGAQVSYTLAPAGKHMAINSLVCLAVAHLLGKDVQTLQAGFAALTPVEGRGAISDCRYAGKTLRIYDEAYNANPLSMRAALAMFAAAAPLPGGRKVVLLGDMLELGEHTQQHHDDLVPVIVASRPDHVHLIGTLMAGMADALHKAGLNCTIYPDANALLAALPAQLQEADSLLFKASNGIGLQKIIKHLTA